jgi:hypothetical protein
LTWFDWFGKSSPTIAQALRTEREQCTRYKRAQAYFPARTSNDWKKK